MQFVYFLVGSHSIEFERKPWSLFDRDVPTPQDEWRPVLERGTGKLLHYVNERWGMHSRLNDTQVRRFHADRDRTPLTSLVRLRESSNAGSDASCGSPSTLGDSESLCARCISTKGSRNPTMSPPTWSAPSDSRCSATFCITTWVGLFASCRSCRSLLYHVCVCVRGILDSTSKPSPCTRPCSG